MEGFCSISPWAHGKERFCPVLGGVKREVKRVVHDERKAGKKTSNPKQCQGNGKKAFFSEIPASGYEEEIAKS